jgi:drug/metabolite transporter (DMT)-like permease
MCASILGILFLCDFEISSLNYGDYIILLSALFASLQIIYLSHFLQKISDLLLFNFFQMLSVTILSLPLAIFFEGMDKITSFNMAEDINAFCGIVFMGVFSTAIGFALQVKSQKVLKAHIAGLIFLVESPIAAVMAFFIFGEVLSINGIVGCLIIGFATVFVLLEKPISFAYRQKIRSRV